MSTSDGRVNDGGRITVSGGGCEGIIGRIQRLQLGEQYDNGGRTLEPGVDFDPG